MSALIWLSVAAVVAVGIAVLLWLKGPGCPQSIQRFRDGSLTLHPDGRRFRDMNEFQQWWGESGMVASCPIPLLTGATRERPVLQNETPDEQTYAKTPIYKVDDYEFSRVFGYEHNGHMEIPRQNFNRILGDRQFDWADLPLSAEQKRGKHRGLVEGFSAAGDLTRESLAKYGSVSAESQRCHDDHQQREIGKLVAAAYADDPDWEPVFIQTGPNNWEVTELKPRGYARIQEPNAAPEQIVDTANDSVDIRFRYQTQDVIRAAVDPWFTGLEAARKETQHKDPYYGPVPGMERMMGPTEDHRRWY